jgi:P-type E1-E2 ATPase
MDDVYWFAGNSRLVQECGSAVPPALSESGERFEADGLTVVYWGRCGEHVSGLAAMGDRIRPGARELVALLEQRGIETQMVSGDSEETVGTVASAQGIRVWRASARPEEKAAWIANARKSLPAGALIGMIGDGVNDAPGLANADIGIAMATGADLASQAAQITLLSADLRRIPELLDLAAQTARVMRQNLFWACLYNVVCIPLAMFGQVRPIWAAVAMMVSSTSVIVNTRRVKWLPGAEDYKS